MRLSKLYAFFLLFSCSSCFILEGGRISAGRFLNNTFPNKSVCGVVKDYHTGALLAGAEITVPGPLEHEGKTYRTDALGYFEIKTGSKGSINRLIVRVAGQAHEVPLSAHLPFQPIFVKSTPVAASATPRDKVADMHYHVSMKAHNEFGLNLYTPAGAVNPSGKHVLWLQRYKKIKVLREDGKWKRPGKPRAVGERKTKKYHKLKALYEGRWVKAKKGNGLYHYTQATFPHMKDGNVTLAFNAISPFEYNLSNHHKKRFFNGFKSHANPQWLRQIGNYQGLFEWLRKRKVLRWLLRYNKQYQFHYTHWQNLKNELNLLNAQAPRGDGLAWKYLKEGNDLKQDTTSHFIVNVLEGAHSLQGPYFMIELNLDEKDKQRSAHRQQALNAQELAQVKAVGKGDALVQTQVVQIEKRLPETAGKPAERKRLAEQRQEEIHALLDVKIREELTGNIDSLKQLSPGVFMVTIGHLSWNGMSSHSPGLDGKGIIRLLLRRFYRIKASDDKNVIGQWRDIYYTEPSVNPYGKLMIDRLISRQNGRRIFIDLKHSDYTTRKYFYDSVMVRPVPATVPDGPATARTDTAGPAIPRTDTVPPICSHCAVNGLKEYYYSPFVDEYSLIKSSVDNVFYPLGINLYDEEIKRICQYNGIIGLTLEERVLGGYMKPERKIDLVNRFRNLRRRKLHEAVFKEALQYNRDVMKIKNEKRSYQLLCKDYLSVEPFLQNLFYILDQSGKTGAAAWDHVCIGSDLDGVIDPIDVCPTASQYPHLRKRLEQFIPFFLAYRKEKNPAAREYQDYFRTITPEAAMNALFYGSLKKFVTTNF